MRALLMYFGKKSHNIQVQLLCATLYGLLSIFGTGGTIAIILKARKLAAAKHKPRKQVVKKVPVL